MEDEEGYHDNLVQAGKANKKMIRDKLKLFMNTKDVAKLTEPLLKAFGILNDESLTRCDCNKVIMIITDGSADNFQEIARTYNKQKNIRIFSFKIGRDMSDPSDIIQLACENNGDYYHVVTLTDINEHVYEYISVLSRPMSMMGSETSWSNVYIGSLDHELKIAVSRPVFKETYSLLAEVERKQKFKRWKAYQALVEANATYGLMMNGSDFGDYSGKIQEYVYSMTIN